MTGTLSLNDDSGDSAAKAGLLAGYDVIVFDCDGVLLDSNRFKSDAFREVLIGNGFSPEATEAFSAYQSVNFGTSRTRLFKLLLEGTFGPAHGVTIETLLSDFGQACRTGYVRQAETPGMREALERAGAMGRPVYVVSGSDEDELTDVFATRDLSRYFAAIFGSPRDKVQNLARVRAHRAERGGGPGERLLFVGDAFADMNAAVQSSDDFLFMAAYSTVRETLSAAATQAGFPIIEDLRSLS